MKKLKTLFFVAIATTLALTTHATSVPTEVEPVATSKAKAEKTKYSYKELKSLTETKMGRKLNGKEKLVLFLAKGKLNKAFAKLSREGSGKSQLVAALLCFFLGGFGIHDFYLGRTVNGILKIVLLLTSFLIIPGIALMVWLLVDLVRILLGNMKPKDGEYSKTL